jgi:ABC-type amino acid transport substrate-binding protein
MYCYSNNGQSMRAVAADRVAADGEVLFAHEATDAELEAAFPGRAAVLEAQTTETANADIKEQIIILEVSSLRTIREILLGTADTAKLQEFDDQIAALRAKLVSADSTSTSWTAKLKSWFKSLFGIGG